MPAISATDVTVTILDRHIEGKKKRSQCTIAFGDGALTYPSGGVPLPADSSFGFKRAMDLLLISDGDDSNGFVWKYDATNKKLRGYQGDNDNVADAPLIELTTAATPAAQALRVEAVGW